MIRLLTAAAVAVLLSTPVMAQNVSPSERYDPSVQNQGTTTSPGSSSSDSMSNQGLSNQAPADCLPNDPRPACQTAQLPGQDDQRSGSSGSSGWQMEREKSGSSGSSGSTVSPGSGSQSPSDTMDR